jgi:2-methylcitrate dehydratase PrpD
LAEWGQVWEFDRHAAIKPYFCLGGIHPFIDAVRQLRKDHAFSAADVDSVVLGAGPLIIRQAGATGPDPRTFLSAQFSAEFSVAMQIVSGGNRLIDYQRLEQNSFDDHEILRIARSTKLEHDQECADLEPDKLRGRVTIKTTAGAELSASSYGLGSVDNPMTPEQILEKYHELVDDLIGTERADEIAQTVMALEEVPSARKLGRLLAAD